MLGFMPFPQDTSVHLWTTRFYKYICVANRFGCEIFEKHTCHCGITVSNDGRHGHSCAKNKGRFSRHSDLNKIFQRALSSIHISSSLEPLERRW
jgi:hypothetical protein